MLLTTFGKNEKRFESWRCVQIVLVSEVSMGSNCSLVSVILAWPGVAN